MELNFETQRRVKFSNYFSSLTSALSSRYQGGRRKEISVVQHRISIILAKLPLFETIRSSICILVLISQLSLLLVNNRKQIVKRLKTREGNKGE